MNTETMLEKIYTFTLPKNIGGIVYIIGGTGGTGGHVVPLIARLTAATHLTFGEKALPVEMWLFDRDVVEQKNITRQNFYHSDIGKVKSETLAKKVTNGFQIPVKAFPKYIEEPAEVIQLINDATAKGYLPIFIGCFDNPQPRKVFHDGLRASSAKAIWIDAGNNKYDGQVILSAFNGCNLEDLERKNENSGFFNLPTICEIDPLTYLGPLTKTSDISCAEHTESEPQTMCANTSAAHAISVIVANLISGKGFKDYEVRFNTESSLTFKNCPIKISEINRIKRQYAETVENFKNGTTTI